MVTGLVRSTRDTVIIEPLFWLSLGERVLGISNDCRWYEDDDGFYINMMMNLETAFERVSIIFILRAARILRIRDAESNIFPGFSREQHGVSFRSTSYGLAFGVRSLIRWQSHFACSSDVFYPIRW